MKYNRDVDGKFFSKKKKIAVVVALAGLLAFGAWIDNGYLAESYEGQVEPREVVVMKDSFGERVEKLKEDVVNRLATECETKGVKEPEAAIIFDSNNEPSIGPWQFQRKTVQHYVKLFEGRDITRREAIEIALDPERTKPLVEKIIFEEGNGHLEWVNCFKNLGLAKEVEIINKLSK